MNALYGLANAPTNGLRLRQAQPSRAADFVRKNAGSGSLQDFLSQRTGFVRFTPW